MTYYEEIRADDPGGDLDIALAYLQGLTGQKDRGERLINERTVYAALGAQDGEAFLQTLAGVAQSADPIAPVVARVVTWLKPGSELAGVDICNTETQALLQSMADGNILPQAIVDSIISLSKETVLKYPGIHIGDVQNARAL
jgi:tryptophan synthase alpha subunit